MPNVHAHTDCIAPTVIIIRGYFERMCRKDILAALLLCAVISFPGAAGDCYDDPYDNNRSYNNCATCHQTFANALINTADNKYRLSRAFFPTRFAPPVEVEVTYHSETPGLESKHFFWLTGGFYVFQPVYILLYRSLFFSAPKYRRKEVNLTLPDSCFDTEYDFFAYTTQRLKGYAQSQSAKLDIDDKYTGQSINKDTEIKYFLGDGKKVILAAYGLPFCFSIIIVVIVFILVLRSSLDEMETLVKGSTLFQANIIAAILLCVIITVYTVTFDIRSWDIEQNMYDLPTYYEQEIEFVDMMNAFFFVYFLLLCVGIVWFFIEIFVRNCPKSKADDRASSSEPSQTDNQAKTVVMNIINFAKKLKNHNKRLALVCVVIAGSTILSISTHFPSVLMAWATDPFYASKIALFYIFNIGAYFTSFHYTYIFSSRAFGKREGRDVKFTKKTWFFVLLSLLSSFVFVSGINIVITVFVISVPISNSIETTSEGVTSIYNGAVILIGGLLAYKIGWYYLGNSFSVSQALQKALTKVETPPFKVDRENDWSKITEEGRLAEVMRAIVKSEGLHEVFKIPKYTAVVNGGTQPQRNGQE